MADLTLPIRLDPHSAPDETLHVTASGLPVRVYATDGFVVAPIHGAVYIGGGWKPRTWLPGGEYEQSGAAHAFDLRDRPKAKRGLWVAWWDPVNGAPDYSTLHRTKGQALAKSLRIESNLISLTYIEEGDGLDTPADPPLWVDWSQLPDWAKWAAADEDGSVYQYEEEPSVGYDEWGDSSNCERLPPHLYRLAPGFDWRETLIQRPEGV